MLEKDSNDNIPIFTALTQLRGIKNYRPTDFSLDMESEATVRIKIRTLLDVAKEFEIDLTKFRSGHDESPDGLLAQHNLLPKVGQNFGKL